jgi:hypothetical protein
MIMAGDAILTLADGQITVLRTPAEARALGDQCRAAEQQLVERNRERGAELDRQAASTMNTANRAVHDEWGSVMGGQPNPPVQHIQVLHACGCAKHETCPDCDHRR